MRPIVHVTPRQFMRLWPRLINPNIDYRVVVYVPRPRDGGWRPKRPKPSPHLPSRRRIPCLS